MAPFDREIILFLNQFAHRHWMLDQAVSLLATTDALKGGVVVSALWWAWFAPKSQRRNRELVVATFAGCFAALFTVRFLALACPFRSRPLADPTLHFVRPYGITHTGLDAWSAFPSDHAALFAGIATGMLLISRPLGLLTWIYVLAAICLSRVYLGLHYPSDILAGGAIGVGFVLLAAWQRVRVPLAQRVVEPASASSAVFYALFFLFTFQVATLFAGVRAVCDLLFTIIERA